MPVPQKGVLFVTPAEANSAHALIENEGGKRRFFYNSRLTISSDEKFFVAGPAVGAPMAAMTLEKLIALGAEEVVMYGWCGAASDKFKVGDVIIAERAVSGEGTSQYYPLKQERKPSSHITEKLKGVLLNQGLYNGTAVVWTTDAPYREDRTYIAALMVREGIQVVDMEYSALVSVANFRKIEFGAVMLVSDELYHTSWKHGFRDGCFKENNRDITALLCGDR